MAAAKLQLCAGRELRMAAGNELRFVKFLKLQKAATNFPWAARPKFDFSNQVWSCEQMFEI
jgi:hypothetical protein